MPQKRTFLTLFLSLLLVLFLATGCDNLFGSDDDDDPSSNSGTEQEAGDNNNDDDDDTGQIRIIRNTYQTTGTTGSDGTVKIDTVSFDREVVLRVSGAGGARLENIQISYFQREGVLAFRTRDPDRLYADSHHFVNLKNVDLSSSGSPSLASRLPI